MVAARPFRGAHAPPLFGRRDLLDEIARRLDHAYDGSGQGLLIVGPGGIGKSRLLAAVVEAADGRGFAVLYGRALPEELPAPFSLVRDLLSSRTSDVEDPREGESALPIFLAPLGEAPARVPAGERTATGTTGPADELEEILAPLGSTAIEGLDAVRDEMLGRLVDTFVERARSRPIVLAIDDLPFADASSLAFLARLARELPACPMAIVATASNGAEAPTRSRPAVEALLRSSSFTALPLQPLSATEVAEFATWILGGRPPAPEEVNRWHAQTEGNPLFVEQLVRTATGSAAPEEEPGGDVTEVLRARVAALGDADRRILTYAAVLGKEFDFASLAVVATLDEERVTEALDHLVRAGLLRERGGEVYEFVTEGLRASVYADLTETRRRILHRKAGRALEAKGASDVELARQFYLGQDDARAVEYNVRAAQAATRALAYDAAVSHIERAVGAERRRPDRDRRREVRFLTEEGRLLDDLGLWTRSDEILEEAVGIARQHTGADLELGRALLALAQTRADRSDYGSAEALATEASHGLGRWGTPRDIMAANRVLGIVFWRLGDLPRAEQCQRAALEIAEREGTLLEQGHSLVDVANTMVPRGDRYLKVALELYQRAAELFARVDEPTARARVLMNRGVLEYTVGLVDEAFRDVEEALVGAERARSPIYIAYCLLNLAQWHAELGRPVPAQTALDRALVAAAPLGDALAEQQAAMTRGMIAEAQGNFDLAETHYQDGLARARELRLVAETSEMLFRLARLAYLRGETAEAKARLADALASGLVEHRPDFAGRLREFEAALAAPRVPATEPPGGGASS